jgi:hypothetical protein
MSEVKMIDIDPIRYRGHTIIHLPTSEGTEPGKMDFAFYKADIPAGEAAVHIAGTNTQFHLAGSQSHAMDLIDDIVGPFP